MALAPEQRSALLDAKLQALAATHGVSGTPTAFVGGAALAVSHDSRTALWVLADTNPARALGPALIVAVRAGAVSLDLIVDDRADSAVLARRATQFAMPITVWWVDGRGLVAGAPAGYADDPGVPAEAEQFIPTIIGVGAEPIAEHGVLAAEVLGLEIARVVPDDTTGELRLIQGVGRFDREAWNVLNAAGVPTHSLSALAAKVRVARQSQLVTDRLARLARERLLRASLCRSPDRLGLRELEPAPPPVVRASLLEQVPCVGVGVDHHGHRVVVVMSSGVDPDFVPFAADARATLAHGDPSLAGAPLWLVASAADDHPITRQLAGLLLQPAEVRPVA